MTNKLPRVLIFDCEFYSHQFRADTGYLLCIGYKWYGEDKVHVIMPENKKDFQRDPTDDSQICLDFKALAEQADMIVGYNSRECDWRFVQTRMLKHRLGYLPPVPHTDLLTVARSTLKMRRSLDNVGKTFGLQNQKVPMPMETWMAAGRGDWKALETVIQHCIADVAMTEEVYDLFRPMSKVKTYVGEEGVCPSCGSKRLQRRGTTKALRSWRQRYQCEKGHWSTGGEQKYE